MKKYFVILMMLILAFSAGCSKQTTDEQKTTGTASPFLTGTEGLAVSFQSGAPPSEVYDEDFNFDINVKLENMGEQTIGAGKAKLKITGINPADFGNPKLDSAIGDELIAARKDPAGNILQGGITNINFEKLQAEKVTGEVSFNLRAEVCYPYQTRAISQICVLEDLLGTTRKAGETPSCEPNPTQVTSEASAGPLTIEKFKQSVIGKDKISFTFDVKHRGAGRIYQKDSGCDAVISNKNKVTVKVDTGNLGTLSCSGLSNGNDGEVTLFSQAGTTTAGGEVRTIVCTQTITSPADYTRPVTITLDYDYESITQPIALKVKHIAE